MATADWNLRTTEDEKSALKLVLPGFTQLELHVEDYWLKIPDIFPKPEIKTAAAMNAAFEAVHISSYQHLFDSLGLTDLTTFLKNPIIKKKMDFFANNVNDKLNVAIFAAGERISLFSIFAWLMSLHRDGRYKGMGQIISWSARDERSHGLMGTDILNILGTEEGFSTTEKKEIAEIIVTVVLNEIDFINQLYNGRNLTTIDKESLIDYTKYLGNQTFTDFKLNLGYDQLFELDGKYQNLDWFEAEIQGQVVNDFFDEPINGGNYISVLSQDFESFDYTCFKEYLK